MILYWANEQFNLAKEIHLSLENSLACGATEGLALKEKEFREELEDKDGEPLCTQCLEYLKTLP